MKILIVDDELISRRKLGVMLKSRGQCDLAADAIEAYSMFCHAFDQGMAYDLITLDFNMPGICGPDLLKKIRAYEEEKGIRSRDKWVKVIMVTAKDDTKSVMSSYQSGCEGYLVKPVSPEDLEKNLTEFGFKPFS